MKLKTKTGVRDSKVGVTILAISRGINMV